MDFLSYFNVPILDGGLLRPFFDFIETCIIFVVERGYNFVEKQGAYDGCVVLCGIIGIIIVYIAFRITIYILSKFVNLFLR